MRSQPFKPVLDGQGNVAAKMVPVVLPQCLALAASKNHKILKYNYNVGQNDFSLGPHDKPGPRSGFLI
jgi:hypothetical protein